MTPRPGKIGEIVTVHSPRPRTLELMGTAAFGEIVNHIRALLYGTHGQVRQPS